MSTGDLQAKFLRCGLRQVLSLKAPLTYSIWACLARSQGQLDHIKRSVPQASGNGEQEEAYNEMTTVSSLVESQLKAAAGHEDKLKERRTIQGPARSRWTGSCG
jgi:hypothetical protein